MNNKLKKEEIRKEKIKLRGAFSQDEVGALSKRICERILESEEYKKAENLLIYNAVNGEVKLDAVAEAARSDGKTVAYPLCIDKGEMKALVPNAEKSFVKGAYGIMEPDENYSVLMRPEELDLVICPLTAFDEKGRRLGMGGGYYDRYLPKCRKAFIAAAAYELQKVEEVPVEDTDAAVDVVFTEDSVY